MASVATAAHELGHASGRGVPNALLIGSNLFTYRKLKYGPVAAAALADPDSAVSKAAPIVGAALAAPTIVEEGRAALRGLRAMKRLNIPRSAGGRKTVLLALGGYTAGAAIPVVAPLVTRAIKKGVKNSRAVKEHTRVVGGKTVYVKGYEKRGSSMISGLESRFIKSANIGATTARFVRNLGLTGKAGKTVAKQTVKGAKDVLPPAALVRAKQGGPILAQAPKPKIRTIPRSDTVAGSVTTEPGDWAAYVKEMRAKKPAGLSWPPKREGSGSGWAALRK